MSVCLPLVSYLARSDSTIQNITSLIIKSPTFIELDTICNQSGSCVKCTHVFALLLGEHGELGGLARAGVVPQPRGGEGDESEECGDQKKHRVVCSTQSVTDRNARQTIHFPNVRVGSGQTDVNRYTTRVVHKLYVQYEVNQRSQTY